MATAINEQVPQDRISSMRVINSWNTSTNAALPADHTLIWIYFKDGPSATDAIQAAKSHDKFKVLAMTDNTANPYYIFPMGNLPLDSRENALRMINGAFKLVENNHENPNWCLYMGSTPQPLVKYDGSVSVIIRGRDAANDTVEVYGQPVVCEGPFFMFCPTCKILNDHTPKQCRAAGDPKSAFF